MFKLSYKGEVQDNTVEEKVPWRVVHGERGKKNQEFSFRDVKFGEFTRPYRARCVWIQTHTHTRRSGCIWPTSKMVRQDRGDVVHFSKVLQTVME